MKIEAGAKRVIVGFLEEKKSLTLVVVESNILKFMLEIPHER